MNHVLNIIKSTVVYSLMLLLFGCGGSSTSQDLTPINTGVATGSSSLTIAKTSLAQSDNTTVTASFTKPDGTPAAGVSVAFTTTLGTLNPATVIAGTDGKASCTLLAGTSPGQGQVTASATFDGKTYVETGNFQVSLPALHLSSITFGAAADTLSYGGTTGVSVSVLDANNVLYTGQEVDVIFTSIAVSAGTASISSPVHTVNGVASTTYKALTITGSDTVTATISGSSASKSLTVTPLSAGSITYVSATPTNLALSGTGGIDKSEVSSVVFKVLDSSGTVRPNSTVDFALNSTIGGIKLSASSGSTGTDGTVAVQVFSGTFATSVRVTATVRGTTISTQSEQLVISTGLPSQDGFSISITTLNPESYYIDGVADVVTARLSDHFHNPVPDGTAVYFTTSGGSIQPSCTTVGGTCSVTWTSQNPRPSYVNPVSGLTINGRARILAYAIGEEAFVDKNANGVADSGEFTDMTGAFRDDNENGIWDSLSEPPIPFNYSTGYDPADGKYNGVLQGVEYKLDTIPKSKHVFSNTTLVMATSEANILFNPFPFTVPFETSANVIVTVVDKNGNTMPAGSTVEFKLTSTLEGTKASAPNPVDGSVTYSSTVLKMPSYDKYTFPNSSSAGGVLFTLSISDPSNFTSAKGVLEVKVISPGGLITTRSVNVN